MRLRSYTPEGAPIWLDQGPSTPLAPRQIHGSLVVSASSPVKSQRLTANQSQNDARPVRPGRPPVYATDEEREAARKASWAKGQAKYRAKLRAAIEASREGRAA